jgi:hypothetical protein
MVISFITQAPGVLVDQGKVQIWNRIMDLKMDNFCWTCKFTLKVNLGWLIVLGLGKARAKLECFSQKMSSFYV